jgi:hypothetical protein
MASVAPLARTAVSTNAYARRAIAAADSLRNRYSHVAFESRSAGRRFSVFGGYRTGYHLAPWFLGVDADVRVRARVHGAMTAEDCRELSRRDGLVVFCGSSAPSQLQSELLRLPVLIDIERPTPTTFEGPSAGWGKSATDNIRRIKRNGFTYDVVDPRRSLDEFYERMFTKTMAVRHGQRVARSSRREIRTFAASGEAELLRVLQEGRVVAAVLNRQRGRDYQLFVLGWPDGDPSALRGGAVAALYWFSFQRAAALSCDRVLLGGSFPCLSEGVLLHKAHWGAQLAGAKPERGTIGLLIDPAHPAARRLLEEHALIAVGSSGELVAVGGRHKQAAASRFLNGMRHYLWRDCAADGQPAGPNDLPRPLARWLTLERRFE